jgi:hypothetical protein
MEAPDGRDTGMSRTAGAISAPACRVRRSLRRLGFVPIFQGNLPRPDTKASLKTTGERFPLVHP